MISSNHRLVQVRARPPMPNLYQDTAEPGDRAAARGRCARTSSWWEGESPACPPPCMAGKGTEVVVLEAQEPGLGASGGNGGQVNPGLKHDPDVVERDHGIDLGRRMNALAGSAPAFVFDLIERARDSLRSPAKRHFAGRARPPSEQIRPHPGTTGSPRRAVEFLDAPRWPGRPGTIAMSPPCSIGAEET